MSKEREVKTCKDCSWYMAHRGIRPEFGCDDSKYGYCRRTTEWGQSNVIMKGEGNRAAATQFRTSFVYEDANACPDYQGK